MTITKELEATISAALDDARRRHHEFLTLEHVLYAMTRDKHAGHILRFSGVDLNQLAADLEEMLGQLEVLPERDGVVPEPEQTAAFWRVLHRAALHVQSSGKEAIDAGSLLVALFREPQSHAVFALEKQGVSRLDVMRYVSHGIAKGFGEGDDGFAADRIEEADDDELAEGVAEAIELDGDEDDDAPASKNPLAAFCVNLNERAAAGRIDPLVGRQSELLRTVQVLCRRRKNNPIFVGEPGVGKTAIVEGLALAIHEGRVPAVLRDAVIYSLDMGALLAGTKFRGEFEQRLKGVIKAIEKQPDAILFVDEIHTVVGAGATSGGSVDASNLLKPALANGQLRCIGSTTFPEYKSSFEKDRALARRFQKIEVLEPSVEETVRILEGLRARYEEHHGVRYTDEALRAAAELAAKYVNDRQLPDKAIDVLDEAGAAERMKPVEERVDPVGPKQMEDVVARIARVPAKSVSSDDEQALAELEPRLKAVIFGQDRAVETIASSIKLSRSGLGAEGRPIGSFLFSGPTGVGKTELARQLAQVLGVEFLRFDMTEYMEKHTVSRLIGAPPGYVGFDQGGLLTDAVRKTPHAVLVLDEIEKAHPDVFNILLQVMDHATLTDNNGRKADFRHVVVILTTNAGAREMSARGLGFATGDGGSKAQSGERGKEAIERTFSPEFRNRLDAWIAFEPLPPEAIRRVVDKFIDELRRQLVEKKVSLELSDAARAWLADKGFDPRFGARPMGRLIQNELRKPLSEAILFGALKSGGAVRVEAEDGRLKLVY